MAKDSLIQSIERTTRALGQCIAEPMKFFAPQEVVRAAQLVALNENVVEVYAYSDVFEMPLAHIKIPDRSRGTLFQWTETVHFNGFPLGSVRITASMSTITTGVFQQFRLIIVIFLGMFATGFLVMATVFRTTVVQPVRRLLTQTKKISSQQMDEAYVWIGDDEFARLGQAIEEMRKKLASRFHEMHRQARTDALTGISNRRDFSEKASNAMYFCQQQGMAFSLVMFDLDNFKDVNDTYGHPVGDQVLNEITSLIQTNIRNADLFARWGGEEFLLALPETSQEQALPVAEKLRRTIAATVFSEGVCLTASFGIAQANEKDDKLSDLLESADRAMYQAKRAGKNRVCIHENKRRSP